MVDHNSRVLAMADDMTGALEAGAKLVGLGAVVAMRPEIDFAPGKAALVIDTETRHVSPQQAALSIREIARSATEFDCQILFKKTDSTLRGNIPSEIGALAAVFPERPIVFVPAYPRLGRTVRGGCLHIDGEPVHRSAFARDAMNPVTTNRVEELFIGSGLPALIHAEPFAPLVRGCVHIFDAETDVEIADIIGCALRQSPTPLLCGPANIAQHIADQLGLSPLPANPPLLSRLLVVNGSRHEMAFRQIHYARSVRINTDWEMVCPNAPADCIGTIVCDRMKERHFDGIIAFGGDTVHAILNALLIKNVTPFGELFPGVPLSKAGDLYLISKAGGFGPVDLLERLHTLLSEGAKATAC